MGIVLARALIEPKLAAVNLPEAAASALPGLPPWSSGLLPKAMPNSTLLAGLLVGLLVVPFIAPLILDAVRSIPTTLREASWALGATRWHTVKHVVLPTAAPGMLAAVAMGALKAVGDVVIVSYAAGYSGGLPTPLWDVLERVPTLTSAGAGLMGGMTVTAEGVTELKSSVGSFTGLLLLGFAVVVLVGASGLERIARRRIAS
jgi:phosphate transport system permease protein